jgi:hypothetical protein
VNIMPDTDLDAIRKVAERIAARESTPVDGSFSDAYRLAAYVPALLAEVAKLRAEVAELVATRETLCRENLRLWAAAGPFVDYAEGLPGWPPETGLNVTGLELPKLTLADCRHFMDLALQVVRDAERAPSLPADAD